MEPSKWTGNKYTTNANGQITVDTSNMDEGIYYLATDAAEIFSDLYYMYLEPSAAMIRLVVEEPEATVIYGDATGDGNVNALDAREILKFTVGKTTVEGFSVDAADVTGDGNVNALDAREILKFTVGKITSFPVENKN